MRETGKYLEGRKPDLSELILHIWKTEGPMKIPDLVRRLVQEEVPVWDIPSESTLKRMVGYYPKTKKESPDAHRAGR